MAVSELYSGSKNFWRIRANIDFHIIEHGEFDIVEIIAFNPVMHIEAKRLLVSNKELLSHLRSKIDEKLDVTRKREKVITHDIRKMVQREAVIEYILSKANVSVDVQRSEFEIDWTGPRNDHGQALFIVADMPDGFTHFKVPSRPKLVDVRHFHNSTKALRREHHLLNEANNKARKIVQLDLFEEDIVDAWTHQLPQLSPDHRNSGTSLHSLARKRWRWAVNRVITLNICRQIKRRLKALGISFAGSAAASKKGGTTGPNSHRKMGGHRRPLAPVALAPLNTFDGERNRPPSPPSALNASASMDSLPRDRASVALRRQREKKYGALPALDKPVAMPNPNPSHNSTPSAGTESMSGGGGGRGHKLAPIVTRPVSNSNNARADGAHLRKPQRRLLASKSLDGITPLRPGGMFAGGTGGAGNPPSEGGWKHHQHGYKCPIVTMLKSPTEGDEDDEDAENNGAS